MTQRPPFPVQFPAQFPAQFSSNLSKSALAKPAPPMSGLMEMSSPSHGMDSAAIRMNMVKKLAALGLTDPLVLQAMGSVERHRFIDSALINQAYEDTSLPIGLGQTISKPGVVGRMLALLRHGSPNGESGGAPGRPEKLEKLEKLGRVLEIGTGCGYQAALLSHLATEVYSMERLRGLHDKARENLRHLRLANVHLLLGDGMAGFPKGAPYAAIIAAAGGDNLPQAWIDQLAMGGRLVAPVATPLGTSGPSGQNPQRQALVVVDKTARGIVHTILEDVHFVPLKSGVA